MRSGESGLRGGSRSFKMRFTHGALSTSVGDMKHSRSQPDLQSQSQSQSQSHSQSQSQSQRRGFLHPHQHTMRKTASAAAFPPLFDGYVRPQHRLADFDVIEVVSRTDVVSATLCMLAASSPSSPSPSTTSQSIDDDVGLAACLATPPEVPATLGRHNVIPQEVLDVLDAAIPVSRRGRGKVWRLQ